MPRPLLVALSVLVALLTAPIIAVVLFARARASR